MAKYEQEVLALLPEDRPGVVGLTTSEVLEKATALPFDYPKKMHRTLAALEAQGLVLCEDGPRGSHRWKKRVGASGTAARARGVMRPDEALALQLLQRFARNQMPGLLADDLKPLIEVARDVLANLPASAPQHYPRWLNKVSVEPGTYSLIQPTIAADVFATVSRALLMEHELEIDYRYRSGDPDAPGQLVTRTVQPLGLVEVGNVGYLVAGMRGYEQPAIYRLDRVTRAGVRDPFAYPESFSLDAYIRQQRRFDFFPEGPIRLTLRFRDSAGDHLIESRMSDDQQIRRDGDVVEVTATVMASKRLRWWIRSFGPAVEVVAPEALREQFAEEARALSEQYRRAESDRDRNCPQ